MKPDRSDLGELLPDTAKALALPTDGAPRAAHRSWSLQKALNRERLVVPIPVEQHPDLGHGHQEQGLGEEDFIPLKTTATIFGPTVVAFTSADELLRWDAEARPMTMSAQRVAVIAGMTTQVGALLVNPASEAPVFLPTPAVHALAAKDDWLPAWEDGELSSDLLQAARSNCAGVLEVRIVPGESAQQEDWMGGVEVQVLVDGNSAENRSQLANALSAIAAEPRLKMAGQSVEIAPKLVHPM